MTGRRRRGFLDRVDAFEELLTVVADGSVLQPITSRISSVEPQRNENNDCFNIIREISFEEEWCCPPVDKLIPFRG